MSRREVTTEPTHIPGAARAPASSNSSEDIIIPGVGRARRWVLRAIYGLIASALLVTGGAMVKGAGTALAVHEQVTRIGSAMFDQDGGQKLVARGELEGRLRDVFLRLEGLEGRQRAADLTICWMCARQRGRAYRAGDCPVCPDGFSPVKE